MASVTVDLLVISGVPGSLESCGTAFSITDEEHEFISLKAADNGVSVAAEISQMLRAAIANAMKGAE